MADLCKALAGLVLYVRDVPDPLIDCACSRCVAALEALQALGLIHIDAEGRVEVMNLNAYPHGGEALADAVMARVVQ